MFVTFQEAVAVSFETEQAKVGQKDCYFTAVADELQPKRDMMAKFLTEAGMKPTIPDGGYFMMADYSNLGNFYTSQLSICNNSHPCSVSCLIEIRLADVYTSVYYYLTSAFLCIIYKCTYLYIQWWCHLLAYIQTSYSLPITLWWMC